MASGGIYKIIMGRGRLVCSGIWMAVRKGHTQGSQEVREEELQRSWGGPGRQNLWVRTLPVRGSSELKQDGKKA